LSSFPTKKRAILIDLLSFCFSFGVFPKI